MVWALYFTPFWHDMAKGAVGLASPSSDVVIVGTVILGRLLLPLLIPKYPLPGVIACFLLDAADQTIFQTFTRFPLDGYQGYDKALDIYYLVIAYLSTMRNWQNVAAFKVARFLFYWRLIGTVLFEVTQARVLLLVFPNTFEYFFIFYEVVRAWWDTNRLNYRGALISVAAIWLCIKLPQEWWIHIAELDATDMLKQAFGVPVHASWAAAVANKPILAVIIVVCVALAALAIRFLLIPRLPRPDHSLRLAGEPMPVQADTPEEQRAIFARDVAPLGPTMFEKVILVSLVSVIFAQILPNFGLNGFEVFIAVSLIAGTNSVVSYWMARRGIGWQGALRQFLVMAAVNALIAVTGYLLVRLPTVGSLLDALFLLLLLTLLVTLYDVYCPVYAARAETPTA
jgi:hypothetical protein